MSDPKNAPEKTKRPVSQARMEANRRNSLKSTGPKSHEGKLISSQNAVTHGLRCETVEPEDQRLLIEARLADWVADLKPEGVAQEWMVRRAVAASVRLDLCLDAEVSRRQAAADRAEAKYVREATYRVGKLGAGLELNPSYVVEHLEATAFGCEWLIAETARLARELVDENGYLGPHERKRALALLGLDARRGDHRPDHPIAGPFLRAALANDLDHAPDVADFWLGIDTSGLGEAARKAEHAELLPSMAEGRLHGLEVPTARVQELESLRDERLEEVDGPAIDEARRRAMLGSVGTKAAERLRRYETGHALDLHRALNGLMKLRKDADRRPAEDDASTPCWSSAASTSAPAPNEANPEAPNEANAPPDDADEVAAPNEAKPAEVRGGMYVPEATCDAAADLAPPSRPAFGGPPEAPDDLTEGE